MNDTGNQTTSFEFTEKMRGYVAFEQTNYKDGFEAGKRDGIALMFKLTIRAMDIDAFCSSPQHQAEAIGYVECAQLGGQRPVERGVFNLFVDTADLNKKEMRYRLFFRDGEGNQLTLSGFKSIQDNVGPDIWADTTTLYVNVFSGWIEHDQEASGQTVAIGMLHILPLDFAQQLTTFRADGPSFQVRTAAFEKFGKVFLGSLWEVYGSCHLPSIVPYQREIPRFTTEGVRDAEITTHSVQTGDKLGLSLLRVQREPSDDVVLIIHGLTTSSDMFIMPEHYNLVNYLHDNKFGDVFTLDFRMSNRFDYNLHRHRFNLDDIAMYDHPAALAKIRELIGPNRRLHVICHCLGSISFMMSLFGNAAQGITSVISNSVALTPRIPLWSKMKLALGPFFVENFTSIEYLNPYWYREPGLGLGKMLSWFLRLFHRECDVPECHMLSFMWGTGFPAVFRHENLLDVTHLRSGDLYGGTSLHYYRHVLKMVRHNNTAVKYDPANPKYASLPDNYLAGAADIKTPVLFITGEVNNIFRDSNIVCHQRLEKIVPGRHQLHVFPNYGHQDVFMGKNCDRDIFPRLLQFLNEHRR